MKKNLLLLFVFTISIIGYGQIPTYYNDVNLNLSGSALKNELASKVINTHTTFLTYTPGVWDALKQTDLDPTDPTKVLLIYGWDDTDSDITNDRTRGKDMNGGNVGDWNREHVYPKSLGDPNLGTEGPGADAHSLRPSDGQRNSFRNSRKFAAGTSNSGTTAQGHWYPGDEWKGDVARIMMYMYLRYDTRCLPINVGVGNAVSGDVNMIDLFLQWNAEDPVSDLEKQRNPILEGLQGNRNPFIDNPAFATQVWRGPQAEDIFGGGGNNDKEAPTAPTNLVASNIALFSIDLSWTAATDNIGVTAYNVYQNGVFLVSTSSTNISITGLSPNTSYTFYVEARDAAGNVSTGSNSLNVTTQNSVPGGDATDLFFSEYIEGSSFNKALEIANFTGATVDLSVYAIKKQTNGAGAWSAGLNLSGSLASGDVYIVANSSASKAILNVADIFIGSAEVTFNGNDAVGLFKNDVLIDIIGTFDGGTANFAKDVTLVRQSAVSSPSTIYIVVEWDSFATDTFTNLGTHSFNGGTPDTEVLSVPASLIATNITNNSANLSWSGSTDNVGVAGYDIYQDGVFLTSVTTTSYSVIGLTARTTYIFDVIAYDAANNDSAAASINVNTLPSSTGSTATLHQGFFESGFDGWIDGGSDVSRYFGARSFEGNYSIRLRDNSGAASAMTLKNVDVSGYDTVDVDFYFYPYSMENNEDFWLRYYDGSSWITVATFAKGTDFENNNFYSATVTLDKASFNFVNNAQFRFQCDASGNKDNIHIDQVSIKGIINGGAARATIAKNTIKDVQYIKTLNDVDLETEEDFIIVSNPIVGNTLQVEFHGEGTPKFRIINLLGQIVKNGDLRQGPIDVSNLRRGVYILELNDGKETMNKKFRGQYLNSYL